MKQIGAARRGKYKHLLDEDQQIRRWYDNVSRGSKVTPDVYIRRLGSICSKRKPAPRDDQEEQRGRGKIFKDVGDFYDVRGAIVHVGHKKLNLNDVLVNNVYAKRAIDKALALNLSRSELITSLDKERK